MEYSRRCRPCHCAELFHASYSAPKEGHRSSLRDHDRSTTKRSPSLTCDVVFFIPVFNQATEPVGHNELRWKTSDTFQAVQYKESTASVAKPVRSTHKSVNQKKGADINHSVDHQDLQISLFGA